MMPDSLYLSVWNIIIMMLLIYTATYIPFETAFIEDPDPAMLYIELTIDALFITDVIANFFSAYETDDKNIEFRLSQIALSYVRSWFLLDIVSCIPF